MIVIDCEQRSTAWYEARLGIPTASNFHKIVTPGGKPTSGKTRAGYMHQLVAESILGTAANADEYVSAAMDRGLEVEPRGIAEYENEFNVTVKPVGFITNDDGTVGCSPDGLVDDPHGLDSNGGIELKCPLAHTHIGYMMAEDAFAKAHWPQVQGSMWITGRSWWNLVSYYPGMKLATVLCERDEEKIALLCDHVGQFVVELAEMKANI